MATEDENSPQMLQMLLELKRGHCDTIDEELEELERINDRKLAVIESISAEERAIADLTKEVEEMKAAIASAKKREEKKAQEDAEPPGLISLIVQSLIEFNDKEKLPLVVVIEKKRMATAIYVKETLELFFRDFTRPPSSFQKGAEQLEADEEHSTETQTRLVSVLTVDMMVLLEMCPSLFGVVLNNPGEFIQILKIDYVEAAKKYGQTQINVDELAIRLTNVPSILRVECLQHVSHQKTHNVAKPAIPRGDGTLGLALSGSLVCIEGTIVRMCSRRVVPYVSHMHCAICQQVTDVRSDPFDRGASPQVRCDNKACRGQVLRCIGQIWMDYTECRLQQQRSVASEGGRLPRSILVALEDDLASKCTVGQSVEVVGIVKPRWKALYPKSVPQIEMVMCAVNCTRITTGSLSQSGPHFDPIKFIAKYESREFLRVALLRSVCPHLAGLFGPRLAVLLSSIGGVTSTTSGTRLRGTIHLLLVGDPATGKSQLLRYAAAVALQSTLACGMSSTTAGLTVAATKEFGEWALEPGALVLSDGGSCIIDELRTVSSSDRTSLHEAMEQQTISVAKAGLVTRLRTACSVIAACNPPTRATSSGKVTSEIGIGAPLLSRFDLVFLLWDKPGGIADLAVSSHILHFSSANVEPPLSVDEMKSFVCFVRHQYEGEDPPIRGPLLSEGASQLLGKYYGALRTRGATPALCDSVPTTVRLLESLIRLTQAHAKLLCTPPDSEKGFALCSEEDAAMAIFLMEQTAHGLKFVLDLDEASIQVLCQCYGFDDTVVHSNARVFSDLFLDSSSHAIQLQFAVLHAVITFVDALRSPGVQPSPPGLGGPLKRDRQDDDDAVDVKQSSPARVFEETLMQPCATERVVAVYNTNSGTPQTVGMLDVDDFESLDAILSAHSIKKEANLSPESKAHVLPSPAANSRLLEALSGLAPDAAPAQGTPGRKSSFDFMSSCVFKF